MRLATTGLETVWLKDVTQTLQSDKRELSDPDLPDQLTFHLKRGADVLAFKLRRNYDIDPNADIYVVQNMKDGQSALRKSEFLEKEVFVMIGSTFTKKRETTEAPIGGS
ncbi:hypothetical protein CHS0354_007933 [Potamilus streckersoni]|uniref:Uncharacterized protein n=1 Tax=Potamilus streckersoni TaxID=2493646 RepID=A0AAE0S8X8_9BIVA|nr:hypothetical protein CHS0354_007933 [Potamilus streckersoni]